MQFQSSLRGGGPGALAADVTPAFSAGAHAGPRAFLFTYQWKTDGHRGSCRAVLVFSPRGHPRPNKNEEEEDDGEEEEGEEKEEINSVATFQYLNFHSPPSVRFLLRAMRCALIEPVQRYYQVNKARKKN